MKVDKANFRANARQADTPNPANCPVRGVKVDGVKVGESGQTRERGRRHLVGPNVGLERLAFGQSARRQGWAYVVT